MVFTFSIVKNKKKDYIFTEYFLSYRLPSRFLKNELPKPIDLKVAALSNVMYCGSNVSLMVSNDLYGVSLCDTLSTAVSSPVDARVGMPLLTGGTCGFAGAEKAEDGAAGNSLFEDKKESEGDYAEVNSLFGDNPDKGAEDGEDTYIEVSEIRRLKAEQRKLKEGAAVTRL
ncbi:uncharacterized protein [Littorina saxatilis]|uniref:uncharacterized protein n=1 Tax=Littorina saxatilis TaxID=31220 RepID=UPI0038B4F9EE